MSKTYKSIENGYAFWTDSIMLPMRRKPGEKQRFFKKDIPFEDAENYWEYVREEHGYSMYYVKRDVSRRLAQCGMPKYHPDAILSMLIEKVITPDMCNKVEENKSRPRERVASTSNWAVEWDDKPILLLVMQKPKMSYKEIVDVIKAEGGYVDSEGIIHKGTAEDKVYTL